MLSIQGSQGANRVNVYRVHLELHECLQGYIKANGDR